MLPLNECGIFLEHSQASPLPDIFWLKDGIPVAKHVTITNSDKGSQMLIPTSERSDTGIYTITVKNIVGQESFNIEIRVTGESGSVVSEVMCFWQLNRLNNTVPVIWISVPVNLL